MSEHKILFFDLGSHIFNTWDWISGYQITRVAHQDAFLEKLQATRDFDLMLVHVSPERLEGLEVLPQARSLAPDAGVMVLSGAEQQLLPLEAYQIKADDYLFLPCSLTELLRQVNFCLNRVRGRRQTLTAGLNSDHQRVVRRLLHRIHNIRHSLDSSAADLRFLLENNGGKMDESLQHRLQEVSEGVKLLVGLTRDYQRQASNRRATRNKKSGTPEGTSQRLVASG